MNLTVPKLECLRCGHKWGIRKDVLPRTCPNKKCRSPYWDTPRRLELTKKDREFLVETLINPPEPNERLKRAVQGSTVDITRKQICGGCGWCLDCLRIERGAVQNLDLREDEAIEMASKGCSSCGSVRGVHTKECKKK